jgi:hypothetical protein
MLETLRRYHVRWVWVPAGDAALLPLTSFRREFSNAAGDLYRVASAERTEHSMSRIFAPTALRQYGAPHAMVH